MRAHLYSLRLSDSQLHTSFNNTHVHVHISSGIFLFALPRRLAAVERKFLPHNPPIFTRATPLPGVARVGWSKQMLVMECVCICATEPSADARTFPPRFVEVRLRKRAYLC